MVKSSSFKYCIVPGCKNSTTKVPDKVFFLVPTGERIRKVWCKVIQRNKLLPFTTIHCCEDHFNLDKDVEKTFKTSNGKAIEILRLKKDVLPHKCLPQGNPLLKPAEQIISPSKINLREIIKKFPVKEGIVFQPVDDAIEENYEEEYLEEEEENNGTMLVEYETDAGNTTEIIGHQVDSNSKSKEDGDGDGVYRWSPPCVYSLLEAYQSIEHKLTADMPRKRFWKEIAARLHAEGYEPTWEQCYSKMKGLKRTYKSRKPRYRHWRFGKKMREIFGKESDDTEDDDDSEKKNELLLKKIFNLRAEHAADRRRRQQERIEVREKFRAILSKVTVK